MTAVAQQYLQKRCSAEAVVQKVQSGNHIFFGEFVLKPESLDAALAQRASDLAGVIIDGVGIAAIPKFIEADPHQEHFIYDDWHFSAVSRRLYQDDQCSYIPLAYNQGPRVVRKYKTYDFAFVSAGPMDAHGYFNFGLVNSITSAAITKAKTVVVEVNDSLPHCLGGDQESVHISRVDCIVEGKNARIPELPPVAVTAVDVQIARYIMDEIEDGACLQFGIGGLPNVIGKMIGESDLKDLGVHTEMIVDSMVDLDLQGKITGNNKTIDRFKMVYTFAMGSKRLYDYLDNNSAFASYPVNYTNDPKIMALNRKVIAIDNAIEVDLFTQVSSESSGAAQISGTGGQLDFILGAFNSRGGKGIIAMASTFTDKAGQVHSRIVPTLRPGSIVTVPRSIVQYVATEYGIVQLKGKSTWERAEAIIGIAHPMFRDELIRQAQAMKIWRRSDQHTHSAEVIVQTS